MPTFPNSKLLPTSQIFQEKITTDTERANNQNEKKPQHAQHEKIFARRRPRSICLIRCKSTSARELQLRHFNPA
jgi:hypothetical protein